MGSCSDLNILDASPLHKSFIDGTHSCIDFEFSIGNDHVFSNPFGLVDGIYSPLSCFVKTISVPISPKEKTFAGWQEAAHKRCQTCVQCINWHLLTCSIELWDSFEIQQMVMTVIILHNMMVQEQLEEGGSPSDDCGGGYFAEDDEVPINNVSSVDEAEEEVGMQLAEQG